jgi:DnaJ-domain-containing protein 1
MTDFFALLDEPRRPWLDPNSLKAKFFERSVEVHPDRVHGASEAQKQEANRVYSELNTAYNCLREPKNRLQHLLELETGVRPKEVQEISPATMELFLEVGKLCRETDSFLVQRSKVTAPVLKVEMFERAQEWADRLRTLQSKLTSAHQELEAELQQMNAAWETAPMNRQARMDLLPLAQLEALWRSFAYLTRWSGQIQDRIVPLSL